MNELRRALTRHTLKGNVDVYDSLRDCYIGRLVNIHVQGLMVMGDVRLDEDRLYQLELHLPEPLAEMPVIRLGADCLWVRNADHNGKHWAGLAIIDVSPTASEAITQLIDQLGEY